MLLVAKRDGETVEFQLDKITMAIKKAFKATGKSYTADIIELLSLRVTSDFQEKIKDSRISVEDIQDSVERFWRNPDTLMWPRHTYCTGNRERKSGI